MTSIRRTLLVRLLIGMSAVAILATLATYVETRREIGDLFDLQLKQLAYSTRIDDLLRGRSPAPPLLRDGRRVAGVSEIVTQIWDRDGVLVYWSQPGAGLPVPVTEGYSDVVRDGQDVARLYARRWRPRAADRACAGRAPRDRGAGGAAHARAAGAPDSAPRHPDLVRRRPRPAPARRAVARRADATPGCAVAGCRERAAAGAEAAGGEPQCPARATRRGAGRAAAVHGRRGARAPHAARGARPAGRAGGPRFGRAGPGRGHGRPQGRRRARVASGRAAPDDGAARARGARAQLLARGSCGARQGGHRRARADRRREGHRPRMHGDGGRSGAGRCGDPRDARRQPARQCLALHAEGRAHRRRRLQTMRAARCCRSSTAGRASRSRRASVSSSASIGRPRRTTRRATREAAWASPSSGGSPTRTAPRSTSRDGPDGKGLAVRVRFPKVDL